MLHDWLNTKPPPQTEPHRLSKRPMLGINVSAPNSPTTGIRAGQSRRARAVSASADIRSAKSSAASSVASVASDASAGHCCEACGSHKSVGKWMRLDPCNVRFLLMHLVRKDFRILFMAMSWRLRFSTSFAPPALAPQSRRCLLLDRSPDVQAAFNR